MSFNDGFSSRGIDSISGSDGEVLTRVAGQWVSAPNAGGGGTFSGVTLDPVNPNLEGHGTTLEPLKVKSNLNVTTVTASSGFNGDGFLITNLSTSVDHVLYVSHDGNDTHVGSLTDPFRTISGAIAYASVKYPNNTDSVLIEVRPGTYSEDLLITRPNLYVRGAAVRPEQRSVQITGKTKVNVSANDKYNSTVAFQGVFFNHNLAAAVVNLSGSTNLTYFKDCYFAANGSNCLKVENVTTASAKVVVSECIFWNGQGGTDIINISGGDIKIDSCEIYFTSTATGNGNGIVHNGNSLVAIDRVLIDLNGNIAGSCIKNMSSNITGTPTLLLSNASLSSITSTDGAVYSTNISYLWNVSFARSAKIKGFGPIATVVYSDLTAVNGLTFETVNRSYLNDYMGNVSGSSFTGSFYGPTANITNITASNITASDVITNYVNFKSSADPVWDNGRVWYNNSTHELNYWTEVNGFNIKLGQQLVQRCKNDQGVLLSKGKVVHISGSASSTDTPRVKLADWTNDNLSANTLGLVAEDIAIGGEGYVIVQGIIKSIDTSIYSPGEMLYLSSSGDYTKIKPSAPKHTVSIGQIVRSANNGSIYVSIQNGYELGELHDVSSSNEQEKDLLVWDNLVPAWKNSKNLGSYTFAGDQQVTGSVFVNTAISASQITGSFSGDGSLLTNLGSGINLTTNGTTGSATLVGGTLNIPKYVNFIPPVGSNEIKRGFFYQNGSSVTTALNINAGTIYDTAAAPTVTSQTVLKSIPSAQMYRVTVSDGVCGYRTTPTNGTMYLYNNNPGFRFVAGYAPSDGEGQSFVINNTARNANSSQFIGLTTGSALPLNATTSPSSFFNIIGFGSDVGDEFFSFMCNDSTGAATKISLGSSFRANKNATSPAPFTDFFEFEIYNPKNSSIVYYRAKSLENNVEVTGSVSTDLPSNTTFMGFQAVRCSGGSTVQVSMRLSQLYCSSL